MTNSKALLLIDIQRDYFVGGAFPLPTMEQAAKNAAQLLSWARTNKVPVVHVRHEELDPETSFLGAGTEGTEIHESVVPQKGETTITKHFPNAFRESELTDALQGAKELIIAGAMSNMCIDATARAAFDLGYAITIVHDACAACEVEFGGETFSSNQVHGAFMGALAAAYGKVCSTQEIMKSR